MRVNLLDVRLSRLLHRHCDLVDLMRAASPIIDFLFSTNMNVRD
jgi:hypothetical protein